MPRTFKAIQKAVKTEADKNMVRADGDGSHMSRNGMWRQRASQRNNGTGSST